MSFKDFNENGELSNNLNCLLNLINNFQLEINTLL